MQKECQDFFLNALDENNSNSRECEAEELEYGKWTHKLQK